MARHGRVVSREELMCAVWPHVAVTDEAVTKCVADIRKAVGDDKQQLIRTVAGRGYLLRAAVTTPVLELPRHTICETELRPVPVRPTTRDPHEQSADNVRPSLDAVVERQRSENPQDDDGLKRYRFNWTSSVVVLLAAAIAAVAFLSARVDRRNRINATDYTQITNFTDSAFSPALSSDGRMLAFVRSENMSTLGGEGDIYVKFLPDGEPVQLTHDGGLKMGPVFTPGGDRIAYTVPGLMTDPMSWSTWTVSVFGGEPKLLLSNASALTWIPGASQPRVLFSQVDTGTHMSIVTAAENRTEERTVYSPAGWGAMAHRSFLSPDGKHLLIVEMGAGGWRSCQLVQFEPGRQTESTVSRAVGPSPGQCSSAAWSPDGEWMYLSVNTGNGYHIWRQQFPHGSLEQVTFGATEEQEIAFAPGGGSFFTSVGTRQSTLWIHDAQGERQLTFQGRASLPQFSPEGKRIYFLLRSREDRRYVSGELWSCNLETGQRERLLPQFLLEHYTISSDGKRILFAAITENGESRLWLGTFDGRTAPRRLSAMDVNRAFFGANGDVFFSAQESGGKRYIYRIREDGSGFQKAFPNPINYLYDVSPDGKFVAAWAASVVQLFPNDGGPPVNASKICAAAGGENRGTTPPCVTWSPNGRYIYLNDRVGGRIFAVPISRGRDLPPLPAGGIASATDVAAVPGSVVIKQRYAFVGADPSVYAFFRVTNQRNIYRIRVP